MTASRMYTLPQNDTEITAMAKSARAKCEEFARAMDEVIARYTRDEAEDSSIELSCLISISATMQHSTGGLVPLPEAYSGVHGNCFAYEECFGGLISNLHEVLKSIKESLRNNPDVPDVAGLITTMDTSMPILNHILKIMPDLILAKGYYDSAKSAKLINTPKGQPREH